MDVNEMTLDLKINFTHLFKLRFKSLNSSYLCNFLVSCVNLLLYSTISLTSVSFSSLKTKLELKRSLYSFQ